MYITIKSLNKKLGKYIEITDLYIGLPMLFIFLTLFSFTNFKIFAVCFFAICMFLLLPIQLSQKNRMYKVMYLVFKYIIRCKNYSFFKEYKESKVNKINEIIQKVQYK